MARARRERDDLVGRHVLLGAARAAPVDEHGGPQRGGERRFVAEAARGRHGIVDDRLAALHRLGGQADPEQGAHADAERAVARREGGERVLEQVDALVVGLAVALELGEAERGAGECLGVARAPSGGRGAAVVAAARLDVAGVHGRGGEPLERRLALGGRGVGAEVVDRLKGVAVVTGGLGVGEHGLGLPAGLDRQLERGLGVLPLAGGHERVARDLGRAGVAAAQHLHDGRVERAAAGRRERLAHRVAHDRVGEGEPAGGVRDIGDEPRDARRLERGARLLRGRPAMRATVATVNGRLSTAAASSARRLSSPSGVSRRSTTSRTPSGTAVAASAGASAASAGELGDEEAGCRRCARAGRAPRCHAAVRPPRTKARTSSRSRPSRRRRVKPGAWASSSRVPASGCSSGRPASR